MGMKGERNAPLSGEAPARSTPESESTAPSPASSVLGDFIPGPTVETGEDVSLEWLSIYVEHCFSSSTPFSNPHSLPTLPSSTTATNSSSSSSSKNSISKNKSKNNKNPNSQTPQFCQETPQLPQNPIPVPAKSRTKRRRITTTPRSLLGPLGEARYEYDYDCDCDYGPLLLAPPDPPLLHQTQWLADSELLSFPKTNPPKEQDHSSNESKKPAPKGADDDVDNDDDGDDDDDDGEEEEEKGKEEERGQQQQGGQGQGQQLRRCTHCLSHKTPQWRAGPLGPKTLCNACGVRFKSGRLLPEYRPAKSPTFVSYKHSNSHKKVMEMRMMAILSSQSN